MIKVSFLGDSITDACGASDRQRLGYVNNLAKLFPLKADKYAIGGARVSRDYGFNNQNAFVLRAKNMDPNTDFVFVMGGTNDFGHGYVPIGEKGNDDEYTFYGGCNSLMKILIQKFGKEKLCFIIPLPRADENKLGYIDATHALKHLAPLNEYRKIIQELANHYQIKTLDLSYAFNDVKKLTDDGLHPNDLGHEIIAKELAKYLHALGFN